MKRLEFDPEALGKSSLDAQEYAAMRIRTLNETEGTETGYECAKCKNKGVIYFARDDGSPEARSCTCAPIRKCVRKMEQSGLRSIIRDYTFDAFETTEQWQDKLKQSAMDYEKAPKGWFLVCGQSGAGKTHICTAICREQLLKGVTVQYMPWRDDAAKIKAMALDGESRAEAVAELKKAPLLYIDDLFKTGKGADGANRPTAADVNLAFEIINYRYINRLPTIISTEKLPEELLEIDEATGGRVLELARTLVIPRNMKSNYRLKGVVKL